MPLWHNPNGDEMNFSIAGTRYQVPAEGVVDIPRHLEYVVRASGLLLKPGPGPKGKEAVRIAGEAIRPQLRSVTDANVGQRPPKLQAVAGDDDVGEDELEGLNPDGTFAHAAGDEAAGGDVADDTPAAGADAVAAAASRIRKAGSALPKQRNA